MKTNPQKQKIMEKHSIQEAYDLANHYNATREEAVNIGISMALNGEILLSEEGKIIKID